MKKRILSFILSLAMIASFLPQTALLAGAADTYFTLGSVSGYAGEVVTIPVGIENSFGAYGLEVLFSYDAPLAVDSIAQGDAFMDFDMTGGGKLTANPYKIILDNMEESSANGTFVYINVKIPEGTEPGTYNISAECSAFNDADEAIIDVYATVEVVETFVPVTGIELSKSSLSGNIGDSWGIEAYVNPEDATDPSIEWTSSKPEVADVKDGYITAVSAGSSVITARSVSNPEVYATVRVSVIDPTPVPDPKPDPDPTEFLKLEIGSAIQRPGQTVEIPITLSENPGVLGVEFDIAYAAELLIDEIRRGDALGSMEFAHSASLAKNPITLAWDAIDPDYDNGVIATLLVTIPEGTEEGEYDISAAVETVFNDNGEIGVDITGGVVTVVHYTPGDVTNDGRINTRDTVAIRRYLAGGYDNNYCFELAADANEDGQIDSRDVVLIRSMVVG